MRHNPYFPWLSERNLSPFANEYFGSPNTANKHGGLFSTPSVNIADLEDKYEIEVAAPGLSKEDFDLKMEKDILTISVNKEKSDEVKEENYTRKEFSFTFFKRSFLIGKEILTEGIIANYSDGILRIELPKNQEVLKNNVKSIEIG